MSEFAHHLKPCPFCGGEAAIEQTGRQELTLRCVGIQPSGLKGCGPKYVQKVKTHSLEWLAGVMAEKWNNRVSVHDIASNLIAEFERHHPELYWHIAKGKITAGEPLYGAIITTDMGVEIGHGESDVSAEDAFRVAIDAATLRIRAVLSTNPPALSE